jgi:anti-sigma B factor antagonist
MREFSLEAIGPIGDCAVLQVTGEVDVYTAPLLRERVLDLMAKGAVHLLVDLGTVDFIDSTGLGVLVGCLKRLRAREGSLTLVLNAKHIVRVFQITGLTKIFPPQHSVSAAIAADPHWRQTVESEAVTVEQWCRQHGLS